MSSSPLALDEVLRLLQTGAQVLDVRDPADFEGAHLAGSINIGLGGSYATWAGTLLERDKPIVLIAEPGREPEAATRLGRIGFDAVAGYLDGGMQALETHPELVRRTERLTVATLAEQLATSAPPVVLDVRTPREWQSKHIAGSLNIPLNQLPGRCRKYPARRRWCCIARAATARRLLPASWSGTASPVPISSAALRPGKPRNSPWRG